jgi:hypothetical protein
MKPTFILFASLGVVSGLALASDRGIAVKRPAEVGLGEYEPDRCHALVIGISQYKFWPNLRCATDDAKDIAGVLRTSYGMKNVKVLLDGQATRRGILEAIDGYTKLTDRDCLFIYYAGHGEMDENRNGFWVPSDAPRNDKFSYIPNSQIVNDYFKKFKVKHLLVAADSCFSGTMLRGGPDQKRAENWELPSGFRKPSRWILTSGDLAPVPDDAGTGHSPFATRVLQYLKYSDAPAFGVQDLYVYVRKNLKSSAICQPLDTEGHMPGGEYVFCRVNEATETTAIPPVTGPTVSGQGKTGFSLFPPVTKSPTAGIVPTPPPAVRATGTLIVYSPVTAVGTLDGERRLSVSAGGSQTFTDISSGWHKVQLVAGEKTWDSEIFVTAGKKAELTAVFPSTEARPAVSDDAAKPVRPKAH